MPFHDFARLLGSGYSCPQRHEAAPHTETLYQAVVSTGLPGVVMKARRSGFFHRKQVKVYTVVEAVARVPAMLADIFFQFLRFAGEPIFQIGHAELSCQISHGKQFPIHQGIEEDGARASVRTVEGTRVIVHANHFIVFPIEQSGGLVAMVVEVLAHKRLQVIKSLTQPFGITARLLHYECSVLRQDGFVHIGLPWIDFLQQLPALFRIVKDANGNPSVASAIAEEVENTAFLVGNQFLTIVTGAVFHDDLPQGYVAQP